MKPVDTSTLVTVMGGAVATNPSWISPLPASLTTQKNNWLSPLKKP